MRDARRSGENASSPTRVLFFRGCFLAAAFFFGALFGAGFFLVTFLERFFAFVSVAVFRTVLVALVGFFVGFFLVAIRAV